MRKMILLALALCVATCSVLAQAYPSKPIRFISPFPAGGPVDAVARMLAPRLTDSFKQSVVVDNRPGANGSIGIETCVRAAPDGYTMMIVSGSYAASAAINPLPYHPVNDVTPIVLIGDAPHLAAVHASLPIASIKDLIAYDKANPGKLNYGSSGAGGSVHLATELFNQMTCTKLTHVPYKGQGPALNDLLGAQIQLMIGSPLIMLPHVKTGRLRGIAVSGAKRSSAMPDIPTIGETVAGFEAVSWQAILGPKALPPNLTARWNKEINQILQTPAFRERLSADAMELVGGSPAQFLEVLKRDVAKWQRVVKVGNIRVGG
jgi:tripartite-type tricarboxylate transporter receptor subunit TctC